MIGDLLNDYGYNEFGFDECLMNHVLNEDNTIGSGKNIGTPTERSWPFDSPVGAVGMTPMATVDILSFYDGPITHVETKEMLLASLANGGNVKLDSDITGVQRNETVMVNKDTNLNLNGKTISKAADGMTIAQAIDGATLTIDGTAEGSKIEGRVMAGIATGNNGNIVIKGGTYELKDMQDAVLQTNGTCDHVVVTATDAVLVSNDDDALYLAANGEYTFKNCIISGCTGIYMKSGSLTIDGGEVVATGAFADPVPNGNGASSTGDAIIMDAKKGYMGNMNLVIKGGAKISSLNGYAVRETFTDDTKTAVHSIDIQDAELISGKETKVSLSNYFKEALEAGTCTMHVGPNVASQENVLDAAIYEIDADGNVHVKSEDVEETEQI